MAVENTLQLEVVDFKDPQHWRWVLKDRSGRFLQDQEVELDANDPNYFYFLNLQSYLDSHSSPDNRKEEQRQLLSEVSAWIGSKVLGRVAEWLGECQTPVTVRVLVPPEAIGLIYHPLELAKVNDKPLALGDLSLVFEKAGSRPLTHQPIGERLRMLALFSLPTDEEPLAMRRERYKLIRLINRTAQNRSLAIELRVLQYGVTRDNLRGALEEGEGWDIIHISGHGDRGSVFLEKPDGTSDEVSSEELADLLSLARGRLKFITLSSCHSAAATIEETLRWLNLWKSEMGQDVPSRKESDRGPMPALAQQLATSLDCAALAMRYTVGDDFATDLSTELYELLFDKGQTLPRALQLSLKKVLTSERSATYEPLSLGTPALFGQQAVDLVIKPPKVSRSKFQLPMHGLAYFPDEPKRFVNRIGPLIRASAALAPESDKKGVMFYGMAGGGKTACALELAYHYSRSDRFSFFVWYKAPDEGKDIDQALLNLAMEIERRLPGLKMVQTVNDMDSFKDFLPTFSAALQKNSILMVLDSLESLLTSEGKWKDERWELLMKALLKHDGYSRVVLTSRRPPMDFKDGQLVIEPVYALSLKEAVILAREMPHLGNLLSGKSAAGLVRGRELVARVLELVQGHPKLIEFAEDQAGDPEALTKYLDKASEELIGKRTRLEAFFDSGESSLDAQEFLKMLYSWTKAVSAGLPHASRTLFHFLCALEEPDRQSRIAEKAWPDLWKRLGMSGQAPDIGKAVQSLKALVDVQIIGDGFTYIIQSGVVEAGIAELDQGFREQVDDVMTEFFRALFEVAKSKEISDLVARAGLSAVPYLLRQSGWDEVGYHLQEVIIRDASQGTIAAVLPVLRRLAEHTKGTKNELNSIALLARGLLIAGQWQEAEVKYRSVIFESVKQGEFFLASAASGDLSNILRDTGRPNEALELLKERKGYVSQASLGPWTQLANESKALQILNVLGRHGEVLEAVERLRAQMDSLPNQSEQVENVWPWNIREAILDAGLKAATGSGNHNRARDIIAEILKLKKARGASDVELAKTAFSDYFSLMMLKHNDQAWELLQRCKEIFERENNLEMLGKVFSALAQHEMSNGRTDHAVNFLEAALRYNYLTGNTEDISLSHDNLAICLARVELDKALAHHLAAGIISFQTNSGRLPSKIRNLYISLCKFGLQSLPTDFDQLCSKVEEVDGVCFGELFFKLAGADADGDKVMQRVLMMVKQIQL